MELQDIRQGRERHRHQQLPGVRAQRSPGGGGYEQQPGRHAHAQRDTTKSRHLHAPVFARQAPDEHVVERVAEARDQTQQDERQHAPTKFDMRARVTSTIRATNTSACRGLGLRDPRIGSTAERGARHCGETVKRGRDEAGAAERWCNSAPTPLRLSSAQGALAHAEVRRLLAPSPVGRARGSPARSRLHPPAARL
jgi:hypothetical protein